MSEDTWEEGGGERGERGGAKDATGGHSGCHALQGLISVSPLRVVLDFLAVDGRVDDFSVELWSILGALLVADHAALHGDADLLPLPELGHHDGPDGDHLERVERVIGVRGEE